MRGTLVPGRGKCRDILGQHNLSVEAEVISLEDGRKGHESRSAGGF